VIAFAWGRRNVASLYRYLDAQHHRTRFNNFFLVARWDPEAALRQKAQEVVMALHPRQGETLYLVIDDSKTPKRGTHMDAVAKMKDPVTEAYIQGHQYVCAILRFRHQVIPYGIRLYVKQEHCPALALPFRKTTELAAQLIHEFEAPAGVKVIVLFDAYYLCRVVVRACRERDFRFTSTLKSNRSLFKASWKLKAGRYGKNLFRRRPTATLVLAKPHGQAHYRFVDAGWLEVSTLGPLHTVFSRKGTEKHILGLVTDDSELSAAGLIQTYEKRWAVEQFFKDSKQLLGLGQYQNRHYRAAVTHLHLVCFAYALLTHLRIMRPGAQGQRTYDKAAHWSTAAAQEQLRCLIWDDIIACLKEEHHGESVLTALEHLRVA
ncbi:MAG: transposase, partial [Candidatus Tectomicrobia bacterium]|nr:transposase [Candidatus Tectomicrobia bacterium]